MKSIVFFSSHELEVAGETMRIECDCCKIIYEAVFGAVINFGTERLGSPKPAVMHLCGQCADKVYRQITAKDQTGEGRRSDE